jgi:hypothetical protein
LAASAFCRSGPEFLAADAFASGAPQSDDMTLVILRVL